MAKLTIEIEENEFALYDYRVYLNGDLIREDENFTDINQAEEYALSNAEEYLEDIHDR